MPKSVLWLVNIGAVDAYVVASDTHYLISAPSVILPGDALPFSGICSFDYEQDTLTCVVDQITAKRTSRGDDLHEFDITIEAIRSGAR